MTDTFEGHAQQTDGGVEYWLGRDLQHLLGYTEWRNFTAVIIKARTACEVSGHSVSDHFVDVNKMVDLGSSGQRELDDIMLARQENVKKVERRLAADDKKSLKNPKPLGP
jgi:DNA-damage-inducible protein D